MSNQTSGTPFDHRSEVERVTDLEREVTVLEGAEEETDAEIDGLVEAISALHLRVKSSSLKERLNKLRRKLEVIRDRRAVSSPTPPGM